MKIAFSSTGDNLDAPLDSRFGRARSFLIYDTETGGMELISNDQNLNAAQGAGIQSAETVARSGAGSVITGHCGPKAFMVLKSAGVTIYNTTAATVREALELFQAGKLEPASDADVESHWV